MFVIVDLSIHSVRFFADGKANIIAVFLYYLHSFSMHLELFFALAFLLSSLKVLFDLTHNSELIALQMAGLSNRRLTGPLFILAVSMTLPPMPMPNGSPRMLANRSIFPREHAKHKKQASASMSIA